MSVESVWEVLAPDGDEPWQFLEELADRTAADRAAIIVDALKIFVNQDWADAASAGVPTTSRNGHAATTPAGRIR